MSRTPLVVVRRISRLEGVAWYWMWSGTLCLWMVPDAGSAIFWLVGAPIALLVAHFTLSWVRTTSSSHPIRVSTERSYALMAPTDVSAFAQQLRSLAKQAPCVEMRRRPCPPTAGRVIISTRVSR